MQIGIVDLLAAPRLVKKGYRTGKVHLHPPFLPHWSSLLGYLQMGGSPPTGAAGIAGRAAARV